MPDIPPAMELPSRRSGPPVTQAEPGPAAAGAKASLPGRGRAGNPVARAVVGTVLLGGMLFYAFFLLLVIPGDVAGAEGPVHYRLADDDDEPVGQPHLVTVTAWSDDGQGMVATLRHRAGEDGPFAAVRMQRIGQGSTFAAELPPLPEGERAFYYVQLDDGHGNRATVPPGAPAAPLLHVRWEGHVAWPVLALHITLMIGALFFLVHGLHFAWRLLGRRTLARPPAVARKAHRAVLWGWAAFFVGGIPLGIYVSGTALGWRNAWGGWPLGVDITDTKTELLAAYWAVVVAGRLDLVSRRLQGWWGDRGLGWTVVGGAVLTAVVYAIPHSLFFQ